jgi:hypothetical protein
MASKRNRDNYENEGETSNDVPREEVRRTDRLNLVGLMFI